MNILKRLLSTLATPAGQVTTAFMLREAGIAQSRNPLPLRASRPDAFRRLESRQKSAAFPRREYANDSTLTAAARVAILFTEQGATR